MENFQGLLPVGQKIAPPAWLRDGALVRDYEAYYKDAMADVTAYWDRVARA
ncbi:MAG: hypothetical protein JWN15_1131, partial [Firmicutes bacterium]|nr:hypothetical protein [Bacillota bacterium]